MPTMYNCRCVFVEPPTVAEVMLRMVDAMYAQPGIIDGSGLTESDLSQLALTVALSKKPVLAFRAIIERWGHAIFSAADVSTTLGRYGLPDSRQLTT